MASSLLLHIIQKIIQPTCCFFFFFKDLVSHNILGSYTKWCQYNLNLKSSHGLHVGITNGRKLKITKRGWSLVVWRLYQGSWNSTVWSKIYTCTETQTLCLSLQNKECTLKRKNLHLNMQHTSKAERLSNTCTTVSYHFSLPSNEGMWSPVATVMMMIVRTYPPLKFLWFKLLVVNES